MVNSSRDRSATAKTGRSQVDVMTQDTKQPKVFGFAEDPDSNTGGLDDGTDRGDAGVLAATGPKVFGFAEDPDPNTGGFAEDDDAGTLAE